MREAGSVSKVLIILLVLATLLSAASCGREAIGGTLLDLTREIPEGTTSFVYWDAKQIEGDDDLSQLRDKWKADNEAWLDVFGIGTDAVNHFLYFSLDENVTGQFLGFSRYGNNVLDVRGDFERDRLRTALKTRNHSKGDWKDIEVWQTLDKQEWLALARDSLIGGDKDAVRQCIDVIEGDLPSLYDSQDAKDVTGRLPNGILVCFFNYANVTPGPPYEGLLANGASLQKKDQDTLRLKLVCKFAEPEDAANAVESIRDDVDMDFGAVKAEQDGRFVILTGEISIDSLFT